ncbi:imidazole glycerol phosphate synthase subunit HisH [Salicibibacter cibarius]|uniref:Imidazole glycerol phosphate synthase subunit HisH n=1 Tax=Salicibibacter cibarius TaxID=2743000 RepID=A0A7T6Z6U5_9BACI|nr:imidazole glycerol phosphate synthase subunit HisH [Salicibibacter cibarius]QQK77871.1 imidazole glycerol phosphate synthase subunit HisH [Salicibibacter cibarius]
MIAIVDYGMGNLYSVSKALERLDTPYVVTEKAQELASADGLILPGVGSFKDAMAILQEKKLDTIIKQLVGEGKPLLGICLGMQLLFSESVENGISQGLDLLPGKIRRFPGKTRAGIHYKVPHMGWNFLRYRQPTHIIVEGTEEGHVYFVHSYVVHADTAEVVVATADYDGEVPAVVGRNHIFGTQFHPEKSSTLGMQMLNNYVTYVKERQGQTSDSL